MKIISKEKKEKIITTFVELFRKYGLDRLSLSDVAEKSGLTKSALYYYFDSKDALIIAGIKYFYTEMNEKLHERLKSVKEPQDVLRGYCAFFFKIFSGEYDEFSSLMEFSLATTFEFVKYVTNSPDISREINICRNENLSFLSDIIANYFHEDNNDKRIMKIALIFNNILHILCRIQKRLFSLQNEFLKTFDYRKVSPITFEESYAFMMGGLNGLGKKILGKSKYEGN